MPCPPKISSLLSAVVTWPLQKALRQSWMPHCRGQEAGAVEAGGAAEESERRQRQ